MKSNGIKYVFTIFIIIILVFAVYKIRKDEEHQQQEKQVTTKQSEQIKEIKLGIAEIDTINPILSKNKNVQDIYKLIYEPLVNLSANYEAEPCLAKEWAKQSDNSYLIKLRENIRWSNSQPFTSEDVQFTIDRLKDPAVDSIYKANVENVTGINIIDDYTLQINLDKEVPFFEYYLTFPILSKEYYNGEDFVNTPKNDSPIGTGQFKIAERQPSYITLEKIPNWWNKEKEKNPVLEKITVNLFSSIGELYNSFKLGNLDLISTTNSNVQEYIGTMGYSSKELKGRDHIFMALNVQNTFLSQLEVRQAILHSIDKLNISNELNTISSNFPLDYGNWLYEESNEENDYNADMAKQILVDAGWIYRNSYWQKTENRKTQRIELNLLVKNTDAQLVTCARKIKEQLDSQGIRVNIVEATSDQYTKLLNAKSYDMALCSVTLSPSPNLETFFGPNSITNYTSDEINAIMSEVKNTTDKNIIKEKYNRLKEIYKTEVPYISLYNNKYIVAYNSELVGEITPNWFYQFYGVEGWYK